MRLALLVLALGPSAAAPANPWARAGARDAVDCANRAREAQEQLAKAADDDEVATDVGQAARWAAHCPGSPDILRAAAFAELSRPRPLPVVGDASMDLRPLAAELTESRARALRWLAASATESRRRREPTGPGVVYFRARALLSTGRVKEAREAAAHAYRTGDVAPWRAERLLSLCALFEGDLELALELADRSRRSTPEGLTALSDYTWALALDRAGDPGGAAEVLGRVVARDDSAHRNLLDTMLPLHERLYLGALAAQLRRDAASAWRLWEAYLARPEPQDAERELARRHLAALGPLPEHA